MFLRRISMVAAAAALVIPAAPAAAHSDRGDRSGDATIELPAGFAGEGVATGAGGAFYAGSLADGRIARGDLRSRTSEVFVSAPAVAPAVGLKADVRHGLLWVAGGPSGKAAVYDLQSGASNSVLTLTTAASFINDVVVTGDAAYFTNSLVPEIYRVPISRTGDVGDPETIALLGPAGQFVAGFNLNGIAASQNGKQLIVVNSATGQLFTVDPATGQSSTIDLAGASVPTGDGLLLDGRTLYVLQNGARPGTTNQIVAIRLDRRMTTGRVIANITSPLFETATTLAKRGNTFLVVNAQFGGAPIDPESEIVVLKVDD
jgi:sugar lactone lactonase YvrE